MAVSESVVFVGCFIAVTRYRQPLTLASSSRFLGTVTISAAQVGGAFLKGG